MRFTHLKIGHVTHIDKGTGLTAFLFDKPVTCGYWLCGSAPATRDVHLLDPAFTVDKIDALLFTGGSAFGLDAAQGVMRWLAEQKRGFPTAHGPVPIVPTASIYDFSVKGMAAPSGDDGYQACLKAAADLQSGLMGAGTGASVGKLAANAYAMTGGFGCTQIEGPSGLKVLVCVVVNAAGDIIDKNGAIIAGATRSDGQFINLANYLQQNGNIASPLAQQNTTLAAVFTNAALNKSQLTRVAKMASAGMARAIAPVFTSYDGDVVFAASLGENTGDEITVGTLSAVAMQQAILTAVKNTSILK